MTNIHINPAWGMKDVYQFLMGHINPQLLLENVDSLDDHYEDETAAEKKKRYEGYAGDFERFQEDLQKFLATFSRMTKNARKTLFSVAERSSVQREQTKIDHLLA